MRRNFNLLFLYLIFLFPSCDYETTKQPAKEAYSYLTKLGITQEQIKAIVLQDQEGDYYLIEDQNEFSSVIEGFIEHENSECRVIKDELKKWGEDFGDEPFDPFKYRNELLNGDIISEYQDKIITIGFNYCKGSTFNLDTFIERSITVKRIDSLYEQDLNNSVVLNDPLNFQRHKPIAAGNKVSMSYYRKVE